MKSLAILTKAGLEKSLLASALQVIEEMKDSTKYAV